MLYIQWGLFIHKILIKIMRDYWQVVWLILSKWLNIKKLKKLVYPQFLKVKVGSQKTFVPKLYSQRLFNGVLSKILLRRFKLRGMNSLFWKSWIKPINLKWSGYVILIHQLSIYLLRSLMRCSNELYNIFNFKTFINIVFFNINVVILHIFVSFFFTL